MSIVGKKIRGEMSGAVRACVCARTADRAAQSLLTFVGARYRHLPNVLCKAEDARELMSAITQIGWSDGYMSHH